MSNYSIDGLIRYFEMAVKVMGYTNPEQSSYEYHAAKMLKQLRKERDEARREVMLWMSERSSTSEMTAEYKKRGWDYLVDD